LLPEVVDLLGGILLVLHVLGHGELAHEVKYLEFSELRLMGREEIGRVVQELRGNEGSQLLVV